MTRLIYRTRASQRCDGLWVNAVMCTWYVVYATGGTIFVFFVFVGKRYDTFVPSKSGLQDVLYKLSRLILDIYVVRIESNEVLC